MSSRLSSTSASDSEEDLPSSLAPFASVLASSLLEVEFPEANEIGYNFEDNEGILRQFKVEMPPEKKNFRYKKIPLFQLLGVLAYFKFL